MTDDTGDPHHVSGAPAEPDAGVSASLGVDAKTRESSSAKLGDEDLVGIWYMESPSSMSRLYDFTVADNSSISIRSRSDSPISTRSRDKLSSRSILMVVVRNHNRWPIGKQD